MTTRLQMLQKGEIRGIRCKAQIISLGRKNPSYIPKDTQTIQYQQLAKWVVDCAMLHSTLVRVKNHERGPRIHSGKTPLNEQLQKFLRVVVLHMEFASSARLLQHCGRRSRDSDLIQGPTTHRLHMQIQLREMKLNEQESSQLHSFQRPNSMQMKSS